MMKVYGNTYVKANVCLFNTRLKHIWQSGILLCVTLLTKNGRSLLELPKSKIWAEFAQRALYGAALPLEPMYLVWLHC